MTSNNKTFIKTSIIAILFLFCLICILILTYRYFGLWTYNIILLVCAALLVTFLLLTAFVSIFLNFSIKNRLIIKLQSSKFVFKITKNLVMPLLKTTAKIFRLDADELERFYIELNNSIVQSAGGKCKNSDILLLLPHCLQNQECGLKITHDIKNCKRCGRCDISDLIGLSEKWGIKILVVTGGTSARAKLSEIKPKAVVAVACERDLASGIKDVGRIPVIGVLNMRPNGPCVNTKVDISEIEKALSHFGSEAE